MLRPVPVEEAPVDELPAKERTRRYRPERSCRLAARRSDCPIARPVPTGPGRLAPAPWKWWWPLSGPLLQSLLEVRVVRLSRCKIARLQILRDLAEGLRSHWQGGRRRGRRRCRRRGRNVRLKSREIGLSPCHVARLQVLPQLLEVPA
jgi:hypothetical protein